MNVHRIQVPALSAKMPLGPQETRHLQVLRLRVGQTVQVFDGHGSEALATLTELEESRAVLQLQGEIQASRSETPQPVTLAIALLKGDKLADVVRAATELGVARVQLLLTQYADAREIGPQKLLRLRRIASEASRQSRRAVTPEILEPVRLTDLAWEGRLMLAHPGSTEIMTRYLDWQTPLTLLSGPEGGFSETEINYLLERGAVAVNLGPRILRAETAPLALLGAIAATGV